METNYVTTSQKMGDHGVKRMLDEETKKKIIDNLDETLYIKDMDKFIQDLTYNSILLEKGAYTYIVVNDGIPGPLIKFDQETGVYCGLEEKQYALTEGEKL